jgi:hypothetical protein
MTPWRSGNDNDRNSECESRSRTQASKQSERL